MNQEKIKCLIPSKTILIHENSLKFSRLIYAILVLISFLFRDQIILLITIILMFLRVLSFKLDFFYQFYNLFLKKLLKDKSEPVIKEISEINFVFAMMAFFLLFGFLLIFFKKNVNFGWIFVLIVDLLMFLAVLIGFCLATLIYLLFKRYFLKK